MSASAVGSPAAIGVELDTVDVPQATDPGKRVGSRVSVFGVECFAGSMEEATELVLETASQRRGGYACFCNVHVLETAQHHPELMDALRNAAVVFPDGAPIAWVEGRYLGEAEARIGGPDLMERVIRDGCALGLRHAFYGSTGRVLERLRATLQRRYPQAGIVSVVAPGFGAEAEARLELDLARLRRIDPHIVWVALGAPRQELWAARHSAELPRSLIIGVGAAFDFLAGTKPRAPLWMQRAGLEWLYRLGSEPRRLGPRYVSTNSLFILRAVAEGIRFEIRNRVPRS